MTSTARASDQRSWADEATGRGFAARPGTVDVHFLPPIDTSGWSLRDVALNRDRVRELYLHVHASMRATGTMPGDLAPPSSSHEPALAEVGA